MFLGIDVGGTSIKAGVFDDELNILKKYKTEYFDIVKSEKFPDFLIKEIYGIYKDAVAKFPDIKSVGCGVPGVVSKDGVIKVAPNMTGIIDFPIKQLLGKIINLPFAVDNDANVAALAELHYGNGVGLMDFIYVTLGTGIGGTIICENKIFHGSSGGAGEIGHIIFDYDSIQTDSRPYRQGTIEVFAGREGILNLAEEILLKYPESALGKIPDYDIAEISELAEKNDKACLKILQITGLKIGSALVSAANILDIPNFVIGGGISKSKILLSEIENTLKERTLPSLKDRIKLLPAKYVEDTGITGAAVLAKFYAN